MLLEMLQEVGRARRLRSAATLVTVEETCAAQSYAPPVLLATIQPTLAILGSPRSLESSVLERKFIRHIRVAVADNMSLCS